MAKVYEFKNRDGRTPLTDEELLLLAAFRQAPQDVQRRMLDVARRNKPEPGRT